MGLIQRVLDFEGLSTIGITLVPQITRQVRPSRSLFVEHPFGLTFGDVGDVRTQKSLLLRCLEEGVRFDGTEGVLDLGFRWTRDDLRRRQLRK